MAYRASQNKQKECEENLQKKLFQLQCREKEQKCVKIRRWENENSKMGK